MILTLKVTFDFLKFLLLYLIRFVNMCTGTMYVYIRVDLMLKKSRKPKQRSHLKCSYNNESVISVTWTWSGRRNYQNHTCKRLTWWWRYFDFCTSTVTGLSTIHEIQLTVSCEPVFGFNVHLKDYERFCLLIDWIAHCKSRILSFG